MTGTDNTLEVRRCKSMTSDQVLWAKGQHWYEGSGQDSQGHYVIGRDSFGSRPALLFYEVDKLREWASYQINRDLIRVPGESQMFDKDDQMIGWFDTEIQAEANGVPEGLLNEFMFKVEGPLAITERLYSATGSVKAVVIKHFGEQGVKYSAGVPLEYLRGFAMDFGLTFIWRPRDGRALEANNGRYFSAEHDPIARAS